MRCLCPNNILQGTYRTRSISPVIAGSASNTLILHPYPTDPKYSLAPEPSYYELVSTVHEHGGFGSTGYRAPWVHEESSKLLLRTHTTASSAHMLYKLAAKCRGEEVAGDEDKFTHGASPTTGSPKTGEKDDGFRPAKLFSIDRVFRNETMDATHLAEFHQVEGVVADRGLTLADLIGAFSFPLVYHNVQMLI